MASHSFSYKQTEAILADAFGVADEKRATFGSRLGQLKKMGLPRGTNTGRGSRVAYRPWHLVELQYCLDLLNAGVTPAVVEEYVNRAEHSVTEAWGQSAEHSRRIGKPYYTYLMLNRLEHLAGRTGATLSEDDRVAVGYDLDGIIKAVNGTPGIIIDLAARIGVLSASIARVAPEAEGLSFFFDF